MADDDTGSRAQAIVHEVGRDEQQQIIYNAHLEHAQTGEQEHIVVQVTGFNNVGAAIRALMDAALHTMKFQAGQLDVREAPVLSDEDIARLLEVGDN